MKPFRLFTAEENLKYILTRSRKGGSTEETVEFIDKKGHLQYIDNTAASQTEYVYELRVSAASGAFSQNGEPAIATVLYQPGESPSQTLP